MNSGKTKEFYWIHCSDILSSDGWRWLNDSTTHIEFWTRKRGTFLETLASDFRSKRLVLARNWISLGDRHFDHFTAFSIVNPPTETEIAAKCCRSNRQIVSPCDFTHFSVASTPPNSPIRLISCVLVAFIGMFSREISVVWATDSASCLAKTPKIQACAAKARASIFAWKGDRCTRCASIFLGRFYLSP